MIKTRTNICKSLVFAVATLIASSVFASGQTSFEPTGTYEYQGKTIKKDGDTYGYFGTIQVKKLSKTKVVMTFYICKGASSYNSGSFVDKLDFADNIAMFIYEECITTFTFTKKKISVSEKSICTCWGHGVYAQGYFRKKSKKEPILTEPLPGEKL